MPAPNKTAVIHTSSKGLASACSVKELVDDPDTGYRARVLLHDLSNVGKDSQCEQRTLSTTHELYISAPYFKDDVAERVRAATVHTPLNISPIDATPGNGDYNDEDLLEKNQEAAGETRLDDAIRNALEGFLKKRKASGDSRPCGPHDLVPIYLAAFGIAKEELLDERFLSRLRRQGLSAASSSSTQGKEKRGSTKAGGKRQRKKG